LATEPYDLEYNGRERGARGVANTVTRKIYGLLYDNPQGMTSDQIHDALRDDWADTDTYRMYLRHIKDSRSRQGVTGTSNRALEYGTPDFMERARRYRIWVCLGHMLPNRTARREGRGKDAVYFAGERSPRVPMHVQKVREIAKSTNEAHVRREEIKVLLLEGINDKRISRRDAQEIMQRTYDYLSGR
jgi:hypothetical protein